MNRARPAGGLDAAMPPPTKFESALRDAILDKSDPASGFAFRLRPSDYARTSRLRRDKSSILHPASCILHLVSCIRAGGRRPLYLVSNIAGRGKSQANGREALLPLIKTATPNPQASNMKTEPVRNGQ